MPLSLRRSTRRSFSDYGSQFASPEMDFPWQVWGSGGYSPDMEREGEPAPVAGRIGVPAPPIAHAVESWCEWMRLRELSDAQITNSRRLALKAARDAEWRTVDDITPSAVLACLSRLQARGIKPKSRNEYRSALKRLGDHCVREGWLRDNPVRNSPRAKVLKSRARVVPSVEDVRALIDAARTDWRKRDRWLVYLTAATTGLRWGQLKGLEWQHVRLDADPPHFDLPARLCKNGEPARVWLTRELVDALRASKGRVYEFTPNAGDAPAARVFRAVPKHTSFDRDLKAAGLEKGEGDGGTLSFHSLRHFASNRMAWVGFTTKERKTQNQHKTEAMTTAVYTDPENFSLGRKVLEMPDLLESTGGAAGKMLTEGLQSSEESGTMSSATMAPTRSNLDFEGPADAAPAIVADTGVVATGPSLPRFRGVSGMPSIPESGRLDSNHAPRPAGEPRQGPSVGGAHGHSDPEPDPLTLALLAAEALLTLAKSQAARRPSRERAD